MYKAQKDNDNLTDTWTQRKSEKDGDRHRCKTIKQRESYCTNCLLGVVCTHEPSTKLARINSQESK